MTPDEQPYDPLASLKEEVARFKATNQFTPMHVTGFYMQAACVVRELEEARSELKLLRTRLEAKSRTIRELQRQLYAYEDDDK